MRMKKVFPAIASAVLATQVLCVHLLAQTTPGRVPIHRFDLRHKRSSWRWLFCWLRRFAASDTTAICWNILFNRSL
jgi:hypothetical protein